MIKKLSAYLGLYKKLLFIIPILIFLDVVCELSMPLLMAKIIDLGIPAKDIQYIIRTGLAMVVLALGAIGFSILNMRYTADASTGFGANLRNALFEKVLSFSFKNIDEFSTSSLITRLTNDVNNLQTTLMMILRILLRAPLMLVIAFLLAFNINAELSVVLAVAIPLLGLGVFLIMRQAVKRFTIVQGKVDAVNNILQENLIGIRVVKSYVREDFEIEKFKKVNDDLTNAAIRAVTIAILNMPVMMLVMNGATLAIIWLGGQMVFFGTLGAGELISFLSYVIQILMSVMMISMVILMSARAEASGKRIVTVLESKIDILDSDLPESPHNLPASSKKGSKVEFKHVSFKYNLSGSGENVLSDIDFTVQPGQIVGIVGGTGTGKSTLVHLIPRLYDVTEGEILVDGQDVRQYSLRELRNKIGMVMQKNTLFSGTIRENLLWGDLLADEDEIITACRDAQAFDFIMSLPNGYDTVLDQGGVNVSGGQKQRLCIARAMLKKPSVLILDDSTSAVDSTTEANIRASFYKNMAGTTVFIIAQRISSIKDADIIIVLDDGTIAGIGTHKQLLAGNSIYQEINHSQQEGAYIHG